MATNMSHNATPRDFLQTIKSFVETVKTGSQVEAASRLGRTQAAISQQIRNLENELNISLFFRKKNRLILTNTGQKIFELSCEILNYIDKIYNISFSENLYRGFSMSFIFTLEHDFVPMFNIFANKYFPNIPITIYMHLYQESINAVLNNHVDISVSVRIPFIDKKLQFEHLFYLDHYLYCPNKENFFLPDSVDFNFLNSIKIVSLRNGTYMNHIITSLFHEHNQIFMPIKTVDYTAVAKSFVLYGLGYGIIAGDSLLLDPRFKCVSLRNLLPQRDIGIYTLKKQQRSPSEKLILDGLHKIGNTFNRKERRQGEDVNKKV